MSLEDVNFDLDNLVVEAMPYVTKANEACDKEHSSDAEFDKYIKAYELFQDIYKLKTKGEQLSRKYYSGRYKLTKDEDPYVTYKRCWHDLLKLKEEADNIIINLKQLGLK